MNDEKYDGVLMTIIQQQGSIDGFFESVFGFLRRKTDFFSDQPRAEKIIVESCKKNYLEFEKDKKTKQEI